MSTKDLQQEMMQYFMKLNEAERRSVLLMIKTFLSGKQSGDRISIEQYNQELAEAEAEFERGEFMSHEDVAAMTKNWSHGK